MIAIVNYGLGNLGSIANMLKVIGERSCITADPEQIQAADGIILPGVGSFDAGMQALNSTGLKDVILHQGSAGKPILGICLGMQLLGEGSEEGTLPGLGLIPFSCIRFRFEDCDLKVPHMGWDIVNFNRETDILENLQGTQRYYFVHSYYAVCRNPENILMTCDYGHPFAAAVIRDNVVGVQFHPEKSHDFGMALLTNFVRICHRK